MNIVLTKTEELNLVHIVAATCVGLFGNLWDNDLLSIYKSKNHDDIYINTAPNLSRYSKKHIGKNLSPSYNKLTKELTVTREELDVIKSQSKDRLLICKNSFGIKFFLQYFFIFFTIFFYF